MFKKKIILIIAITFIYFGIYFCISANNNLIINSSKINSKSIYPIIEKDYYSSVLDFEKIEIIAQDVANSHEYKLHVFDCTDFSKELKNKLRELGYKAQCTAGMNYAFTDYPKHTWISVWINNQRFEIESTGGYFISKEDYKTYDIKWENFCW